MRKQVRELKKALAERMLDAERNVRLGSQEEQAARNYRNAKRALSWRGGVRIVDFNRLSSGENWLSTPYAKRERSTRTAHELRTIREGVENG